MGTSSFSITQGSWFLSEEIHEAKLSLIMITGCYQNKHHQGQEEEDDIADFRMA